MKNIEKYKDIVLDNIDACSIDDRLRKMNVSAYCEGYNCEECKERVLKWLLEEAKEPVLDDAERKYLSEVIRPFKNYVTVITKLNHECETGIKQYIRITVNKYMPEYINLPYFEENAMYKCMKVRVEYKLKELGL